MGSIGRYIFRTTFGAFLLVLVSLTSTIWLTQALRDVDLMTGQGQTILVFIGITSLIIPQLVMVIAPVALVVAASHNLHKLATDSEIIVMNGAGMRPWGLLQPFIAVTVVASMVLVVIGAYAAPESLRTLRRWSPRYAPIWSATSFSRAASCRSKRGLPSISASAGPTACWSAF